MLMPMRSHQTDSRERLKSPIGEEAKGTLFFGADRFWQTAPMKKTLKGRKGLFSVFDSVAPLADSARHDR